MGPEMGQTWIWGVVKITPILGGPKPSILEVEREYGYICTFKAQNAYSEYSDLYPF